jgi:hypothetical protein
MITKVTNTVLDLLSDPIDGMDLGGNIITGSGSPIAGTDLANKSYVDGLTGGGPFLSLSGGTMIGDINMDGNEITSLPAPSLGPNAANRDYVDGEVSTVAGTVLGVGQTWADVTGSRTLGVPVPNGPRTIAISVIVSGGPGVAHILDVGGVPIATWVLNTVGPPDTVTITGVIPPGATYTVISAGSLVAWTELF